MPIKRLGKPPFLKVNEVTDGDLFVIVEAPYLVPAEKSKWNKERYRMVIKKFEDKEFGLRTWTLNTSTSDNLLNAFGEDERQWVGKKIKLRRLEIYFLGEPKFVLYGEPYIEPQKTLEGTC